jgi:DNA polymerase III epsilon subunit family exonuclease
VETTIGAAYRAYLEEQQALDFDDLIWYGLRLFDTRINPQLASEIHQELRFVFVDEFHDLSPEQYRFLELLCPPKLAERQVMVVADPNQAIYGWRNASAPETIGKYQAHYQPEEFFLAENYRSAGNLVRAAQHLIRGDGAKVIAKEVHADEHPIDLVAFPDHSSEATWLANQIKRACETGKYSLSDIAVLYRANSRADLLEVTLLREGIPLQRLLDDRFFDDQDVQATIRYLSLLQAMRDEQFEPSLYWPRVLVDELTMAHLQQLAGTEGLPLIELARRIDAYRDQVSPLTRTVIKDFLALFEVELAEVANQPINIIVKRLLAVLRRNCSPFTKSIREDVKGILTGMAQQLKDLAKRLGKVIAAGRQIVLVHDEEIDTAAGALILAHIFEHYFNHPVAIQLRGAVVPQGAFVLTLGETHPPAGQHAGLGVYRTPRGTLAYSVSVQAWRLGQLLLMHHETERQGHFVLFDLETTGTHIRSTEILEMAALEIEAGKVTGRSFEALVRPKGQISAAASQVHGIGWEQVKDKPPIEQALPAYLAFLNGATLVGHNIEAFDYPVLHRIASELGLAPPTGPLIDTCKLARRLLPDNSHRLQALAQLFGHNQTQTHRALDDVRMNADVFFHLLDMLDDERTIDIASEVLPLVALGIQASGLPQDDYQLWFAQAGARALHAGLGTTLCDRLSTMVTDPWELDEHCDWLRDLGHADPEEDRRWSDLESRWENALNLFGKAFYHDDLEEFLRFVKLASAIDHRPGDEERISLMTIHGAKGKEWPLVFIVGAEDGTIPSFRCATQEEVDEERRVLYVAMTRAKRRLVLTYLVKFKGYTKKPSRLLDGIPADLIVQRRVKATSTNAGPPRR